MSRIPKSVLEENTEKMSVFGVCLDDMSKEELKACLVMLYKQQKAEEKYQAERQSFLFDCLKVR